MKLLQAPAQKERSSSDNFGAISNRYGYYVHTVEEWLDDLDSLHENNMPRERRRSSF